MYPYTIQSIGQIHPHLVNIQGLQGVNASNAIGTPIDPLAVIDAENTVAFLSAVKSKCFLFSTFITNILLSDTPRYNQVIETAKNRAHVLRGTRELFLLFVFV
jgi:hypothetical protein